MSDKKLNAPDAFQVQAYTGLDWLIKHKTAVAGVAAAVLLAFGARAGYKYSQNASLKTRQEALVKIDEVYANEQESAGKEREAIEKQIQALRASATPAPAAKDATTPPPAPALSPETQKHIDELRAKADAIEPNHQGSDQQYAEFFAKNDDTPEGWYAAFRHVDALLKAKKTDEARKVLDAVAQKSKGQSFYELRTKMLQVGLAEEAKDFDAALKGVEELLGKAGKELQPQLLLTKARLLVSKNDKAEANKVLDGLLKDHAESPVADKARGFKSLIN